MKREPIHAKPVSDETKAQIFDAQIYGPNSEKVADDYLNKYIEAFLTENQLKNHVMPKIFRRRLLVSLVYSIILFLDIVHLCLWHEHYVLDVLVFLGLTLVYIILLKRMRMDKWLRREVKKRPMDPIDNVLASQVSGSRSGTLSWAAAAALPVITLIAAGFLFAKPHFIFEKNNSGYDVRYYTLALQNDDKVVVPETYKGLPVNEIRGKTFCSLNITSVQLPFGITEIRGETFQNCRKLSEIVIPEGVERIGGHAFENCRSLASVTLPRSLGSIGSSAFRQCKALREIDIPDSVVEIGQSAFRGCDGLEYLRVPASVREIGPSAFRECRNLKTIDIPKDALLGEKVFKDTNAEVNRY